MTVLVTGATGFLGRNLLPVLVAGGYTVRALYRRSDMASELTGLGAQPVLGDLLDSRTLRAAMAGTQVVIHAAANTAIWPSQNARAFRTTVSGTRAVLSAARDEHVQRVIHVGSANSFGPAQNGDQADEQTPFHGLHYGIGYITQKQQAQRIALTADPPAIVINPTFLFGPHDHAPGSGRLIQQLARAPAVFPYPLARGRNVASVATICRGVDLALRNGIPGECYLLGGSNLQYRALFELICKITGSRTQLIPVPPLIIRSAGIFGTIAGHVRGADPGLTLPIARAACDSFFYSSAKAERHLGYLPDDIEEVERSIYESFAWLCKTGRIAMHQTNRKSQRYRRAVSWNTS